jgi:hypothetical protein
VKALALDRYSYLGLSISHASCIRMQTLKKKNLKEIKSKQKDHSQEINQEYEEYDFSKQAVHLYSYYDEKIH